MNFIDGCRPLLTIMPGNLCDWEPSAFCCWPSYCV